MRTTLRRALAVAAALAVVGATRLVAFTDEGATKPLPPPKTEGTPALEPDEPTVAAATPVKHGIACARGWSFFDNPALHYGICLPPGWGFTELDSTAPLERIRSRTLANLRVFSPDAFPWHPGDRPIDAIVARGIQEIELDLLEPGAAASTECEPSTPLAVAARTFLTCEQTYDALGIPAVVGVARAIKVVVPLVRAADLAAGRIESARLLVVARHATGSSDGEVDALWRIVRSIRPW